MEDEQLEIMLRMLGELYFKYKMLDDEKRELEKRIVELQEANAFLRKGRDNV